MIDISLIHMYDLLYSLKDKYDSLIFKLKLNPTFMKNKDYILMNNLLFEIEKQEQTIEKHKYYIRMEIINKILEN